MAIRSAQGDTAVSSTTLSTSVLKSFPRIADGRSQGYMYHKAVACCCDTSSFSPRHPTREQHTCNTTSTILDRPKSSSESRVSLLWSLHTKHTTIRSKGLRKTSLRVIATTAVEQNAYAPAYLQVTDVGPEGGDKRACCVKYQGHRRRGVRLSAICVDAGSPSRAHGLHGEIVSRPHFTDQGNERHI